MTLGPHSHSELATARRCLREYHFRYELRREPIAVAEALTIGKRVDRALKVRDTASPDRAEAFAAMLPKERALVLAHEVRWRTKPIVIEQTDVGFSVVLNGVEMVGELDAIGTLDGERVGVEYKTTSEDLSPGSTYWRRITRVDPQASIYLAALEDMGIRKLVFDVLRKSALRERKDENADGLFNRTIEDIGARPDWYFARQPIVRLDHEREEFARDVRETAELIQLGKRPRNPDACIRFGRECEFLPVCSGEASIEDDRLYRNREPSRKLTLARHPTDGEVTAAILGRWPEAIAGALPKDPGEANAGFGEYRF